jgi:hypothetical protein
MSLYILGKIIAGSDALMRVGACVEAAGASLLTSIDGEDRAVLDELLPGTGLTFSIADGEGGVDATGLWSDVTDVAVRWSGEHREALHLQVDPPDDYFKAIADTRLAKFVRALTLLQGHQSLGLAFVDGGISTVCREAADEIYRTMAWEWRLPWDMSSNRLYVWSPG